MYEGLDHLVDKIGWLRHLKYSGQEDFGRMPNGIPSGMALLRKLEVRVQEREGLGVGWKSLQPRTGALGGGNGNDEGKGFVVVELENENENENERDHRPEYEEDEVDEWLGIMGASESV